MEKTVERARLLLRRGDELLGETEKVSSESLVVILLAAAAEAYSASILALSPRTRRRDRLCERSTKRIISTALMELRRLQLITHEEMERLKRVLQGLRCIRNHVLHPWEWCLERCREVNLSEAMEAVKRLAELARRAYNMRAGSGG